MKVKNLIDLHVHSTLSDGVLSPEELLVCAKNTGVKMLAIADHETISSYDSYLPLAERFGIHLIPAIEINVSDFKRLHILGYFIQKRVEFEQYFQELRKRNQEICYAVLESLKKEYGIKLTALETVAYSPDRILDKKAIAKILIARRWASNIKEVYDKYIGTAAKSYIPIEKMNAENAIKLIHKNGGVAVWAHPYTVSKSNGAELSSCEFDALSKKLSSLLLDGIEVYTTKHSLKQKNNLLQIAKKYKLAITGGSDFHSPVFHTMGISELTQEHIDVLCNKVRYKNNNARYIYQTHHERG